MIRETRGEVNEKKKELSTMILNYLRKNPDGGDTLEGITKWWLDLEMIEISVDEVSSALESLIQKGIIRKHRAKGGTTIYKIKDE
ncbi:hypothetical protein KAR91_27410 [Candidatus Pacearchaeota archaeon]|nr:hypothetical protein [Candidatus Pacearchaeota archaeon]